MTIVETSSNQRQRVAAIVAWVLLGLLLVGRPLPLSFEMTAGFVLIVSVISGISLVLLCDDESRRISDRAERWLVAIALAIPLAWVARLGTIDTEMNLLVLFAVAIFPQMIAIARLIGRPQVVLAPPTANLVVNSASNPPPDFRVIFPSEPSDHSVHEDAELLDEAAYDNDKTSHLTQWLQRSVTDDGELIEGGICVDYAESQREATVHVSFCPPFETLPEVTALDLDGDGLEIRVAATFKFGARLTVRRPAHPTYADGKLAAARCRIGFIARSPGTRNVA